MRNASKCIGVNGSDDMHLILFAPCPRLMTDSHDVLLFSLFPALVPPVRPKTQNVPSQTIASNLASAIADIAGAAAATRKLTTEHTSAIADALVQPMLQRCEQPEDDVAGTRVCLETFAKLCEAHETLLKRCLPPALAAARRCESNQFLARTAKDARVRMERAQLAVCGGSNEAAPELPKTKAEQK